MRWQHNVGQILRNHWDYIASYKDYKTGGSIKEMTLAVLEFIRRFALHILPHGFGRIRHFGILSSRGQVCHIPVIQAEMGISRPKLSKQQIRQKALSRLKTDAVCPCCGQGNYSASYLFPEVNHQMKTIF